MIIDMCFCSTPIRMDQLPLGTDLSLSHPPQKPPPLIVPIKPRPPITTQNGILRHPGRNSSLILPRRGTRPISRVIILIVQWRRIRSHSRPTLRIDQAAQIRVLIDHPREDPPRPTKIHGPIQTDARSGFDSAVIERVPGCVCGGLAGHGGYGTTAVGDDITFAEPGRSVTEDVVHGS